MKIIQSLLDTDYYKLTMGMVVFNRFPDVNVKYEFKCRNQTIEFTPELCWEITDAVNQFCQLRFKKEEIDYLATIPYFKKSYLEFLRLYQPNINHIKVHSDGNMGLAIDIEGPWFTTIYYEVPLLAIVNEVVFKAKHDKATAYIAGEKNLAEKLTFLRECETPFTFMDFGTRRRYSCEWQYNVVKTILNDEIVARRFFGTSNVMLAKEFGVKPVGTMAHEFLMAAQALTRISESQKFAFQTWAEEYRGDLGIALSDVVGMDAFLRDFDLYFSKLFDGARHDSGDPLVWGDKLVEHYKRMKIDPMTKLAVFSDGLTFLKIAEIAKYFEGRIRCSFGIGTDLTNDLVDKPLNIVIKLVKTNGRPVAKISDSPGKQMCKDQGYLEYLSKVFNIKLKD